MSSALVFIALLRAASAIGAQDAAAPTEVFPGFASSEARDGLVELYLEPAMLEVLRERERVVLEGFPWDGGLALELERVHSPIVPGAVRVDGRPVTNDVASDATYWSGRVAGDEASDVFLAFFPDASQGWVRRGSGETVHLMTGRAPGRDRAGNKTVLVGDGALEAGGRRFRGACAAATNPALTPLLGPRPLTPAAAGPAPTVLPLLAQPPLRMAPGPVLQLYRGRLAVETDWQFFQIFGSLPAAQVYVTALLAAANVRFVNQLNADVRVDYLGFHTTQADPWTTQDQPGAICFDTLYEFQAAWSNGGAPVPAELHLFLSGVDLGCGVAFIAGLCTPDRSFSLMSRMNGLTPFPVAPSPLNWDFVFTAHELGHSLGSLHTHEYCPPLDQCSPPGYFGPCQTARVCTNQAGLMSYCHSCPGGVANYTTSYHPVVAAVLRAHVAGCFPLQ